MAAKAGKNYLESDAVEAFREIGQEVASETKKIAQESLSDMWKQILGSKEYKAVKQGGEMAAGQEIDFSARKQEQHANPEAAPAIDYHREILHGEQRITRENERTITTQIQEILIELKRIASSSKEIEVQFREVMVEQRITKPGEYHVSFFQWVLTLVRTTRMKVEDSAAWLNAFKGKKAKQGYWDMFQKHGTSFGMSNERSIATQAG